MAPKKQKEMPKKLTAAKTKPRPPPKPKVPERSQWLCVPAKECLTCRQTTHDIDFDSPPGRPGYVQWFKKTVCVDGSIRASG